MTEIVTPPEGNGFLAPGLYRVDSSRYHGDQLMAAPALSSTIAKLLLTRSPAHAFLACPRLNPGFVSPATKTFDIGRAFHAQILGAGDEYVTIPADFLASNGAVSTKAAKEFVADARANGLTPIKAEESDELERMTSVARDRLAQVGITIDPARSEIAVLAEVDGVAVRALIDHAPSGRDLLLDVKTTENASLDACIRSVTSYNYAVQAAHYTDAWHAVTGERRRFIFCFVEKAAPYEVALVELYDALGAEADWMETARDQTATARRLWAHCLATNSWPGYSSQIAVVGAPGYFAQKWADRARPPAETIARAAAWQAP